MSDHTQKHNDKEPETLPQLESLHSTIAHDADAPRRDVTMQELRKTLLTGNASGVPPITTSPVTFQVEGRTVSLEVLDDDTLAAIAQAVLHELQRRSDARLDV